MSTIHTLPDSERDVKSCVIAGLGLVPPGVPAAGVVESCLLGLLEDDELDPLVRSYVPTSLGKIGGLLYAAIFCGVIFAYRDFAQTATPGLLGPFPPPTT